MPKAIKEFDVLTDLTPEDVKSKLDAHSIVLIDVREPREFAAERIHGALNFPLSTFDPTYLPTGGPTIVFQCGTGKRSAMAADKASVHLGGETAHLAGGITAWKQDGHRVVAIDPETGAVIDPGK
ncbi:MAG: rhodanese-like domain-containing protein [Alphaproteobacteria bacterium]|nr:rhodanese-like domain-containing protein [Alphaproteobacteria bacterium]MBO6628829.1 rhodanese-like domain-containing protein [Alphaproteobacteria bacterium]